MAIGLGRMFGFEFVENFNYPYIAKSVTDFWRRWHISLSTWFREYIYIPLGGNRVGKLRGFFNLAVVWFLTGFWHGADWNYILWGVYFWIFLVIEKAFLRKVLEKIPFVSHVYTLLVIGFGWIIFFYTDLSQIGEIFKHLIGIEAAFVGSAIGYEVLRLLPFIIICAIGCTPLPKMIYAKLCARFKAFNQVSPFFMLVLFIICIAYMVDNTFSPFLYYIF